MHLPINKVNLFSIKGKAFDIYWPIHSARPERRNPFIMNEIETFYGWIEDTEDALRVFELCRKGQLGRVRRRLHDEERQLIRSGSIFVFEEDESGMKRWTDGRLWSPSRILGHFLIYRELDKKRLFKDEKRKRSNSTGDLNSWNASRADRKFSLMKSLMDEVSGL